MPLIADPNDALKRCLDDLEARIDAEEEGRLLGEWRDFSEDRFQGAIFSPRRSRSRPPAVEWPNVSINAALDDFDMMALQQYGGCSAALQDASGALLNVRPNYGSSIAPLLFGVEPYVMDEELETLPTSRPLNDRRAIRRLIEAGVPDLQTGYGARVLKMGERFAEIARQYPRIGRHVFIYHPDMQGPMDICEVVWGSSLFYAVVDEPGLVKDMLELAVRTYIAFMRKWEQIVPFRPEGNTHWGLYHRGKIMLRDDSAMNFSQRMFEEFIAPYDQRLLDEFGGGAIHMCGRADHYIPTMAQLRGLYAINLSQPELNDMETIYRHTVDSGIKLIGLDRRAADAALARGRDLRGQVHCL
jgi:hypothetical protein